MLPQCCKLHSRNLYYSINLQNMVRLNCSTLHFLLGRQNRLDDTKRNKKQKLFKNKIVLSCILFYFFRPNYLHLHPIIITTSPLVHTNFTGSFKGSNRYNIVHSFSTLVLVQKQMSFMHILVFLAPNSPDPTNH